MLTRIYKLTVNNHAGKIVQHFTNRSDATRTFNTTYSKVDDKPTYTIEEIEVLNRWTHL